MNPFGEETVLFMAPRYAVERSAANILLCTGGLLLAGMFALLWMIGIPEVPTSEPRARPCSEPGQMHTCLDRLPDWVREPPLDEVQQVVFRGMGRMLHRLTTSNSAHPVSNETVQIWGRATPCWRPRSAVDVRRDEGDVDPNWRCHLRFQDDYTPWSRRVVEEAKVRALEERENYRLAAASERRERLEHMERMGHEFVRQHHENWRHALFFALISLAAAGGLLVFMLGVVGWLGARRLRPFEIELTPHAFLRDGHRIPLTGCTQSELRRHVEQLVSRGHEPDCGVLLLLVRFAARFRSGASVPTELERAALRRLRGEMAPGLSPDVQAAAQVFSVV